MHCNAPYKLMDKLVPIIGQIVHVTHEPKIVVFMVQVIILITSSLMKDMKKNRVNMNRLAITMFHISPWTSWCLLLDKLSMLHMNQRLFCSDGR